MLVMSEGLFPKSHTTSTGRRRFEAAVKLQAVGDSTDQLLELRGPGGQGVPREDLQHFIELEEHRKALRSTPEHSDFGAPRAYEVVFKANWIRKLRALRMR